MIQKELERKRRPYSEFKQYLSDNGIPQSDVGKIIGVKAPAINQKINGTGGDFTVEEVKKICTHYEISAQKYFFPELVSITKCRKKEVG